MTAFDKTLVLAGTRPKRVRLHVFGAVFRMTTWSGAKAEPKTVEREFADERGAQREFATTYDRKLRADYVVLGEGAQTGDVLLEAFAPGAGSGALFDLSRDGTLLATATTMAARPPLQFGVRLEVVEVATGARRIVTECAPSDQQGFLHTILFDRAGTGLYYLVRDTLFHVALAGAVPRIIGEGRGFNAHVVQPTFDHARRRLVTFADHAVRVLDEQEATLLEVPTASPTTECRATAISPSGRLLALYIVSRGIVYGHADAQGDHTNEVRIYDIDAGELWETVVAPTKLHRIGIAPSDDTLLVTHDYAKGPYALAIPSGEERWRLPDEVAFGWRFSHDGSMLAVGGHRLALYEAATRAPIAIPEQRGRSDWNVFSADDRMLASLTGSTAIVRRI